MTGDQKRSRLVADNLAPRSTAPKFSNVLATSSPRLHPAHGAEKKAHCFKNAGAFWGGSPSQRVMVTSVHQGQLPHAHDLSLRDDLAVADHVQIREELGEELMERRA